MSEPAPSRFRVPHPGWLALATATLVLAGFSLAIWVRYYRQQLITEQIVEYGGKVDWEDGRPDWLRRRVGTENVTIFDRIIGVSLQDTATDDEMLAHLAGLPDVATLDLRRTQVSDAGVVSVRRMAKLESLWLAGTRVGDVALGHLKGMQNLTGLNLDGTRVSDAGLMHLAEITSLQHLNLNRTNVSDAGLAHLKRLTHLTSLGLQYTKVSKAGCNSLSEALPDCEIRR